MGTPMDSAACHDYAVRGARGRAAAAGRNWVRGELRMRLHRRAWVFIALVVAGASVAILGGASTVGAASLCSSGRPFCVTVTDLDGRSVSTTSPHYMKYTVAISRNGGTSNLTNGTLTLTLTDIIG